LDSDERRRGMMPREKCETRLEAMEKGEKYYFTGIPCRTGHISKRQTSIFMCMACHNLDIQGKKLKRKYGITISPKTSQKIVEHERLQKYIDHRIKQMYGVTLEKTCDG
jgi:hypothetical protein